MFFQIKNIEKDEAKVLASTITYGLKQSLSFLKIMEDTISIGDSSKLFPYIIAKGVDKDSIKIKIYGKSKNFYFFEISIKISGYEDDYLEVEDLFLFVMPKDIANNKEKVALFMFLNLLGTEIINDVETKKRDYNIENQHFLKLIGLIYGYSLFNNINIKSNKDVLSVLLNILDLFGFSKIDDELNNMNELGIKNYLDFADYINNMYYMLISSNILLDIIQNYDIDNIKKFYIESKALPHINHRKISKNKEYFENQAKLLLNKIKKNYKENEIDLLESLIYIKEEYKSLVERINNFIAKR